MIWFITKLYEDDDCEAQTLSVISLMASIKNRSLRTLLPLSDPCSGTLPCNGGYPGVIWIQ